MASGDSEVHLVLFFTWDVSLRVMDDVGLLSREMQYYNRLADGGVKVSLLTWGDERDYAYKDNFSTNMNIVPVYSFIPRPRIGILRLLVSFMFLWSLRDVLRSASILKTNQMSGAWCALAAKLIYRKPLIVRSGYELMRFTLSGGGGFLCKVGTWLLSQFCYWGGDKIYLATEGDARFVRSYFKVDSGKISVRPNWIDTDVFRPQSVSKKRGHILFVGRLEEQKNIGLLIDAVSLISKKQAVVLDIVGRGSLESDLRAHADMKGVKVNFLNRVDNIELPALMNSYDVFVLPSRYEGNPKTLLEAMSCGLGVVGTDVVGISSVIKDGETGLLCSEDAADLAQKIKLLLGDKTLRRKLGAAARDWVIEVHGIEDLLKREQADYGRLLGGGRMGV